MKNIEEYIIQSYQNSVSKGWYEEKRSFLERAALMNTEIAEATEEVRNSTEDYYLIGDKPEGQAVELADLLIRIFDYLGYSQIDIQPYIKAQFKFLDKDLITISDIINEIKTNYNLKILSNLKSINTDLEFHAFISISISDAVRTFLKQDFDTHYYFLVEAIIKVLYFSNLKCWNIESIIEKKHLYNINRPHKHGGKKC
jgi:NTP pyrophosphatase (non-canonical NTP hydrolase)